MFFREEGGGRCIYFRYFMLKLNKRTNNIKILS